MKPHDFALLFTCLIRANVAHTTTLKQSALHFKAAYVGENVTLPCFCQDDAVVMLYWFKQNLGQKPKLASSFYRHNVGVTFYDEFNNTRFSLDNENSKNHLKMSHLQNSDSATYYCLGNNLLDFEFCESITVSVKGSGLNIPALVHQSASETIQPGGSETLNCTVHTGTSDGEHRVYWFRHSEESHPGLIYTHGGREDNTCVYNLPMKSLNLSHAGTYYCAVASCGHIVFGDRTKPDFEDEVDSLVLVYILSGALAFTSILVILLAFSVYKMTNFQCAGCSKTFSATCPANTALREDEENLHYAALREQNTSRPRRQRNNTRSECVYSTLRQ
ncbi:uncharacterized protein [Pempheris klunzingeri]|uniref:uncharacterized protein n=1 Tax=Pempheris klunzingeri TaxID=3127111 RepID=UPI00397F3865